MQEFTDVNEKVNELRSKNVKITNDLLKSEDAIHELKQELNKKDKFIEDLEKQIDFFLSERRQLQHEKQQEIKKVDEVDANIKLNELNLTLQKELSIKENDLSSLANENNELKRELNKVKERINENSLKYEQQISEISLLKDKEVQYFQNEYNKVALDNERLASLTSKLQQNKRQLEEELVLYNEKKEAIAKCEQQMNEILQMVNEERLVRDNLKYLASKLIQEVDTLRSQCIYSTTTPVTTQIATSTGSASATSNNLLITNTSNSVSSGSVAGDNAGNTNTWRNRCSERRDRINVQNLQVALEKEIQAKEDMINENKSIKLELELKQTKIVELQMIIEDLSEKLIKSNENNKILLKKQLNNININNSNNNNSNYDGYDNLANFKSLMTTTTTPTRHNPTTISELVNGDTLYAIDDDDDYIENERRISNNKINEIDVVEEEEGEEEINEQSTNKSSSSPNVQINKNTNTPTTITTTPTSASATTVLTSINSINNAASNNLKHSKSLKAVPTQYKENASLSNASTLSSVNIGISSTTSLIGQSSPQTAVPTVTTPASIPIQQHRFEVISFHTMERCMMCSGVLYGICRQAVRCKNKTCSYLCHTKCRLSIPENCPLNINQHLRLKNVDYKSVSGTLMQGTLRIPKPGGVKKGWIEHYVFISNARLFICPIIDSSKAAGAIPVQIVDIRDTQFNVSNVNESDVIHANKRDLQCIFKVIVTKLKHPDVRQQILFCAKDVKDKDNWIQILKDLNARLIQNMKISNNLLPIEAKEICDATSIRNAISACVYDAERLLVASEEGIDLIDIKADCRIQRFHDKKTYLIDLCREEKLIVAISGKSHQIYLFPTIWVEGINTEVTKIEETKGCNMFCVGRLTTHVNNLNISQSTTSTLSSTSSSIMSTSLSPSMHILCVAVKKVIYVYELNSSPKPKYKRFREIELTMQCQSMQIINNQLCIGFQSDFALYSLLHEEAPTSLLLIDEDRSLEFLSRDPINALMNIQISSEEYLLVFESKNYF